MSDHPLTPEEEAVVQAIAAIPLPAPPTSLPERFRGRLLKEVPVRSRLHPRRWALALAASVALVAAGGAGWEWQARRAEVALLRTQLTAALSDLSEARRFQAITAVTRAQPHDRAIVEVLTTTLLADPNTNVRVAAIEALTETADHRTLYQIARRALDQEDSPFVLAALLDASATLSPTERGEFLRSLLAKPTLMPGIRTKAEARLSS